MFRHPAGLHRVRGLKTGRQHHLLSDIEWRHFLLFDWADDTEDIREQFPLDRALTQQIAEDLGIRHPLDPTTKVPLVMTSDLVVDVIVVGRLVTLARAIKPAAELSKPRILKKLEIERRYWLAQNVEWGVLTERDVPMTLVSAILWVHQYGYLDNLSQPYPGYFEDKARLVLRELEFQPSGLSLWQFCQDMDDLLDLET